MTCSPDHHPPLIPAARDPIGAPEVDAVLSIADRCAIARQAASLDERLSWYAPHAPQPQSSQPSTSDGVPRQDAATNVTRADEILDLWQRAFSPGDRESFTRRLSWEGLDLDAVRAALADETRLRTAPAWTTWLLRFSQQAIALGRDLPTTGLPVESGWIAPRDEPPFIELWIPIVRAMRVELTMACRDLANALTSPVRHAIERQWLKDIVTWGEQATTESFRTFEPDAAQRDAAQPDAAQADTAQPHTGKQARHTSGSARRASARYQRFVDRHLGDGLSTLFKTYPVLARQLSTMAQTGVEAAREFIVRLNADRAAIAETFAGGRDPGALVALDPGLSDPHHGRRRVIALHFASGLSLIYKPRDIAIEQAWNGCLTWMRHQGLSADLAPPALRVLARDGYGWMEFARHEPAASIEDVHAYYQRAGALLCLSWIFGARDLHAENVIATARGPVIVDAEMLLQPQGSHLFAPAEVNPGSSMESTCLDTGLLSLLHRQADDTMLDIGGLRGNASNAAAAGRTNRILLDGVAQPVESFGDDVRHGFAEAYRFAIGHVRPALDRFARCRTRVAFRTSEQYAALQRTLAHPRFQRHGALRSCALDALNRMFSSAPTRPKVWTLVEEERRALERLDIPRFTARAEGRSVTPGGSVGPIYAHSGLEAAELRIDRLSPDDLDRQLLRIADVLGQSTSARLSTPPPAPSPQPSPRKRGEGVRIPLPFEGRGQGEGSGHESRGDDEADGADTFRRHAEWIGRELLESLDRPSYRFRADPDGRALSTHALYGGTLGPAFFFAALSATADGDDRWADAARAALEPTRRWLDAAENAEVTADPLSIGITSGLGSIVYAGVVVSALLRDPALLELSWRAAALITPERIRADERFDLADGAAGAIVALLALAREAVDRADDRNRAAMLDELLGACGDHLVATQVPRQIGGAWPARHGGFHIGFAHGAAGIAWALAGLHARLGRDRYQQAAARALAFEESQFVEGRANWPVLEMSGPEAPLVPTWMHAWCHGAPGILLARALAHRDGLRSSSLRAMAQAPDFPTDHLCCGAAGHAEILLTLGQLTGDPNAIASARTLGRRLIARARERGHFRLTASGAEYPIADPGFFQGLSGIGYHLLRLADPQSLPSVLAFATVSTGTARPARTLTSAAPVTIVPLKPSMASAVAYMTFPSYRHLLSLAPNVRHPHDGDTHRIQPIGVVAILDGRPVGLALAEIPLDRQPLDASDASDASDAARPHAVRAPELLSLFVDASLRRRGIGVALVAALEEAVASGHETRLDAVYMTGKADVTALERIFAARGWQPPAVRTLTLRFTVDEAARMPWYGRVRLRDADFEIFPWGDLLASEREALVRSHLARPWILEGLEFWRHDHAGFDPVSSLGLRYRGEVVGWTINHCLGADTTRISGAFVRDDLMRRGRLMALWTDSISRMRANGVRWITSITPVQLQPMIDFLSRRVAPWATFRGETRGTHVVLTPSDAWPDARTRRRAPSVHRASPVP